MIQIVVLASGSSGNAIYLESRGDALLIDAGISRLQIERRISDVGGSMENVRALLVSHEHSDHIKGMSVLMKRHPFPAYMTEGTLRALSRQPGDWTPDSRVETFQVLRPFRVGAWAVRAFPTPHDAEEPVGFILEAGGIRVGIATDMGEIRQEVVSELSGVHGLVLEFNHDPAMLASGPYPPFLKARIAGPGGHLSTEAAGGLLESVAHRGLGAVILAHLSETNNHPELVRRTAAQHLNGYATKFEVASRDAPKVLRLRMRSLAV